MIVSNVSNTKNKLSELLQKVQHGEEVTIVDRDRPVARIVGIVPEAKDAHMARLVAQGTVVEAAKPGAALPQLIDDGGDYSLLDTLLTLREEERA